MASEKDEVGLSTTNLATLISVLSGLNFRNGRKNRHPEHRFELRRRPESQIHAFGGKRKQQPQKQSGWYGMPRSRLLFG